MLVVTGHGLGAVSDELSKLKTWTDRCLRALPFGSSNADADMFVTCEMYLGGSTGGAGMPAIEKMSFIDQADNAAVFNISRSLLTGWRNVDTGGGASPTEATVRRIAAQKLGEEPVLEGGPAAQAAQTLASAGRIEGNRNVKLAIINSLGHLLRTRDESIIPSTVRTEAITTLKIFADPNIQSDPYILNAANDTLKSLIKLEIGPITVTPVEKPPSKWRVPLIAMGVTAVVATGGLIWFLRRPHAPHVVGMGRLRRKVELSYYRRHRKK